MARHGDGQLTKSPTGIEGIDSITSGGFPAGRVTLVVGGPGCGKTVLALQTLVNGARLWHEPGVFIAFEEHSRRIVANAASFGWDLPELERRKLVIIDAQLSPDIVRAGSFDLTGLLAGLDARIRSVKARRVVFDALDVVLRLLPDRASRQREIYRLHEWLLERELTAIVTAKAFEPSSVGAEDGTAELLPFMVDCAVELHHDIVDGVSHRTLRVVKYRGSGFSENPVPCLIGPQGIQVAGVRSGSMDGVAVTTERVSSGVARLDAMLGGGYFRGASILVTGAPGTAKTTLGGAFASAACRRGERTLFVSFDSSPAEITRNLDAVNIRLGHHARRGTLRMVSARAGAMSAELQLMNIQARAREQQATCLVIDPISALSNQGNDRTAHSVAARLIDWAKLDGLTVVCTSLLDGTGPDTEGTPLQISTIADTWLHLNYQVHAGERNRGLTIVKSRGTTHSNQVRELILDSAGVTLADVFTAGGEVLMGTLRWEKEMESRAQQAAREEELRASVAALDAEAAELKARLETLAAELSMKQQQRAAVLRAAALRREERSNGQKRLRDLRRADGRASSAPRTGKHG
jgi:circadian clock protein KaiC